MNSLAISQLDYYNALYYGLPSYLNIHLQRVQNTAPRLISCTHKYDHITPVLIELHWLPIEYRLKFKILLHVFKAINGLSPTYLTNLIAHQLVSSRSVRSSDSSLLFVQRTFAALVNTGFFIGFFAHVTAQKHIRAEDLIINPHLSHVVHRKLKSFLKDLIWHPDYGNVLAKCLHVMKENGENLLLRDHLDA